MGRAADASARARRATGAASTARRRTGDGRRDDRRNAHPRRRHDGRPRPSEPTVDRTLRGTDVMPSSAPLQATKFIFVTGGVVSSLGKGIAAASLGRLLVERGLAVSMMK